MKNDLVLSRIRAAQVCLQKATTLQEVNGIIAIADAALTYAKRMKASEDTMNYAGEIALRAEFRLGEMLSVTPKAKGAQGNPGGRGAKIVQCQNGTAQPTLESLGITKKQSSRSQALFSVGKERFEKLLKEKKVALPSRIHAEVKASLARGKKRSVSKEIAGTCTNLTELVSGGLKFGTIYADPPWAYSNQSTRAATDNHYDTMTVEAICALPVKELTADKAHLHLWTTNAFLFECPKIFEAWGFVFKSSFVWVKPGIGIGNYWRNSHEILLTAVKGGQTAISRAEKSWLECARGKHSAKPEEVRTRIERLSPGPFLELFGRSKKSGWTVFGDQISTEEFSL